MFAEALLLIAVAGVGVFERGSLVEWQHRPMLPAMLVVMFVRLDAYTRPIHRAART